MKLNRIITKITISIATFFVLFGFAFIDKVSALTISPDRIEVTGDPGTTITKDITLFNDNKNSSETYYVSYSNFDAQDETGSPHLIETKNDLGTWMNAGTSVVLEPGKFKTIPLSITIPKDAFPGGHFAIVFFGNYPNTKDDRQVSIAAKMGTLILLSVNGNILEAGGLSEFKTKDSKFFYNSLPFTFLYRFKNDGNDRIKPEGNITIHNIFYFPSARIDANSVSGNILSHSTRLFNVDCIKYSKNNKTQIPTGLVSSYFDQVSYQWHNFAVGPYLANIDLTYGRDKTQSSKYTLFFVFPWQLLIVIFIILVIIFLIGRILIKKYNRYIIKKAQEIASVSNR